MTALAGTFKELEEIFGQRNKISRISYYFPMNIAGLCREKYLFSILLIYDSFIRFVVFKYKRTVSIQGIEGHRYEPDPETFDNGTSNPENRCFCSGECVPSGALNVSLCRLKAPAFASYPHFYQADSSYRDTIEGMKPDPEKHNIYLVLEPVSFQDMQIFDDKSDSDAYVFNFRFMVYY